MSLINLTLAKKMTGIEDEATLEFYIAAIISKIEKILGYSLSIAEKTDYPAGMGKANSYSEIDFNGYYIWLPRKPVVSISSLVIRGEEIPSDKYELRDPTNMPHIMLSNSYLNSYEEAKVTYTAGFEDEKLDNDIMFFIFRLIKEFDMAIDTDTAVVESYKIDTISYKFLDFLKKQNEFYNQISEIFGLI